MPSENKCEDGCWLFSNGGHFRNLVKEAYRWLLNRFLEIFLEGFCALSHHHSSEILYSEWLAPPQCQNPRDANCSWPLKCEFLAAAGTARNAMSSRTKKNALGGRFPENRHLGTARPYNFFLIIVSLLRFLSCPVSPSSLCPMVDPALLTINRIVRRFNKTMQPCHCCWISHRQGQ